MQSRLRNHVAAALLSVDVRAYVTGMLVQMLVRGGRRDVNEQHTNLGYIRNIFKKT